MKRDGFSIIIPTWNNLKYLRLCYESLKQNSSMPHQILVHINEGSDGTLNWVREQGIECTSSTTNVGICWAVNEAAMLADRPYIVYMNDDMYVLPQWDTTLYEEIEGTSNEEFYLSSTMIEPRDTGNPCVIASSRYGDSIENFREDLLLKEHEGLVKADWSGSTWPPSLVSRRLWHKVGGYSVEFSPGMYSDPDFSMKLWRYGVRHFKGVGKSHVFHFQCKTTGRIQTNDGRRQFLRKWGLSGSHFMKEYLKRGELFQGPLGEPPSTAMTRLRHFGDRLRGI